MSTPDRNSPRNEAPETPAGTRIGWLDVPERVRGEIERRVGSAVVGAESKAGGFSPALASVLQFGDGSSLFVKAVGPEINPDSPVSRYRWGFDEGPDGWVVLAFDVIAGRQPATPWIAGELELVFESMVRLAESLTPSPVSAASIGRTDATWGLLGQEKWRRFGTEFPELLDSWTERNLDRLIALESAAAEWCAGESLIHCDLRSDNLLITGDEVVVVDWPHARVGPAWIDPIAMAPSVTLEGGPDPESYLMRFPSARDANPRAIDSFIAVVTGFFLHNGAQPDPPGLPTLRAFQRAQGEVALTWLKSRLPSP